MTPPTTNGADRRPVVITGGAGFIGCNVADRLLSAGERVVVVDNLSRPGVESNLAWLQHAHGELLQVEVADVRDAASVRRVVRHAGYVFHFAAQVAVTTSLIDAVTDFEINARGTLNVLEAIRGLTRPPGLLFTSTNKVYGALDDLALLAADGAYVPEDPVMAASGVDESRPLDFHSPYGCSKGAADQYVIDYARTFRLPAAVFRMSCIYGPHQCGTEDQGWVAFFVRAALRGEPLTVNGDGRQVRDILHVDDLVDAMLLARARAERVAGRAFNIGGGPARAVSLLGVLDRIEQLLGHAVPRRFDRWRPGDQRYYVSNTQRFTEATGWTPRIGVADGLAQLSDWMRVAVGTPAPLRSGTTIPVRVS